MNHARGIPLKTKALSVLLSGALVWTSGSLADAALATQNLAQNLPSSKSFIPQYDLIPSTTLGRITDHFITSPKSNNTDSGLVVLIQDLHAHYGVQKKNRLVTRVLEH